MAFAFNTLSKNMSHWPRDCGSIVVHNLGEMMDEELVAPAV